jgi:hypothetical protein
MASIPLLTSTPQRPSRQPDPELRRQAPVLWEPCRYEVQNGVWELKARPSGVDGAHRDDIDRYSRCEEPSMPCSPVERPHGLGPLATLDHLRWR